MKYLLKLFLFFLLSSNLALADTKIVKVGLAAILSGDLAVFGTADLQAAKLYLENFSRHPIKLIPEDARLSSSEGLLAFQKLVNLDHVDVLIAAGTSNAIMAATSLIRNSKTVTLMASTAGKNIDRAGEWIFRIGNSDTLNGIQQSGYFSKHNIKKVALLSEQTEYTIDIAEAFKKAFQGELVFDQEFLPGTTDFRTQVTKIINKQPEAIFMPTQTGTALGIFLKQLRQQDTDNKIEIHTTMVAAPNHNAHAIAGKAILGVHYMAPVYGANSDLYKNFIKLYQKRYNTLPSTPFHAAAVVDSLEHLQNFLDKNKTYDAEKFKRYLSTEVKQYCGYMGCYSLNSQGNSDLGFQAKTINRLIDKTGDTTC